MTATAGGTRPRTGPVVPRRRRRPGLVLAGAAAALVAALLAGIWVGALALPPGAVVVTLLDRLPGLDLAGGLSPTQEAVLLQLRLPRVVLAALVGAGLAISGGAYQGVFRNPLADPYLLGADQRGEDDAGAAAAGGARPPGWGSALRPGRVRAAGRAG